MALDSILVSDLSSDDRYVRLSALAQIIDCGESPRILEALRARRPAEADLECKELFEQAVEILEIRLSAHKPAEGKPAKEPETDFCDLARNEKIRLLLEAEPTFIEKSVLDMKRLFLQEKDQVVKALILKTFKGKWPQDFAQELSAFVRPDNPLMRLAAVEALTAISPDKMRPFLPRLLVDRDLRTRILAIRSLVEIDEQEAIAHLRHYLFDETRRARYMAIQCCFFIPFDAIKSTLLEFLAFENDPELIDAVCTFFAINPDLETARRLWQLHAAASGKKREVLWQTINEAHQALLHTGEISQDFADFSGGLKAWAASRKARQFVFDCLNSLKNEDSTETEEEILRQLENKKIRELFETMISSEDLSEHLKRKMTRIFSDFRKAGTGEKLKNILENGEEADKISWLASLNREDYAPPVEEFIGSCFSSQPSLALKAAAFRLLTRIKKNIPGLDAVALQLIKLQDENLVASAIEYLNFSSPDAIIPHIGNYLNSESMRIKCSALKVFLDGEDKVQANLQTLSIIKACLIRPETYKTGLSLMFRLDFSLVREMLGDFLLKPVEADVLETGLILFQSNPDFASIYLLYRIEQKQAQNRRDMIRRARNNLIELLQSEGPVSDLDPARHEASMQARWQKEIGSGQEHEKPYSARKLLMSEAKDDINSRAIQSKTMLVICCVFMAAGILYSLSRGAQPAKDSFRSRTEVAKSYGGQRISGFGLSGSRSRVIRSIGPTAGLVEKNLKSFRQSRPSSAALIKHFSKVQFWTHEAVTGKKLVAARKLLAAGQIKQALAEFVKARAEAEENPLLLAEILQNLMAIYDHQGQKEDFSRILADFRALASRFPELSLKPGHVLLQHRYGRGARMVEPQVGDQKKEKRK